jgi:hypothetical protein
MSAVSRVVLVGGETWVDSGLWLRNQKGRYTKVKPPISTSQIMSVNILLSFLFIRFGRTLQTRWVP